MTDDLIEKMASDLEHIAEAARSGDATINFYTSADFRKETEIIELKIEWGKNSND